MAGSAGVGDTGLKETPGGLRERREFASEIKFLVPIGKVDAVQRWARTHLQADPHGTGTDADTYRITSLYFDSPRFDVFRGNGSYGRSKYRVRRYNGDDIVFLERKAKTRTWVSKRRSPVHVSQLPLLANRAPDPLWPGFWFHRRLLCRGLEPVCQIHYLRTARVGMAEGHPIRLTLDRELMASRIDSEAYCDPALGTPLAPGTWILELKYRHALPTLFKRLITELAPSPQRVSKYRLAVNALGLAVSPATVTGVGVAEVADA